MVNNKETIILSLTKTIKMSLKPLTKDAVYNVALELLKTTGSTTTLHVKNKLREDNYNAVQNEVSEFMAQLADENKWNWNTNGTYRNYYIKERHEDIRQTSKSSSNLKSTKNVFIGHGRSKVWKDLKDFLKDRLQLNCVEYNLGDSVAGLSTKEVLENMLREASFAFIIMTADDEHADNKKHARENVVHEIGLFQGKLGFRKAIILLEEGCEEFSNITGINQIRFRANEMDAKFEEIRRVLEREGMIR